MLYNCRCIQEPSYSLHVAPSTHVTVYPISSRTILLSIFLSAISVRQAEASDGPLIDGMIRPLGGNATHAPDGLVTGMLLNGLHGSTVNETFESVLARERRRLK